MISAIAYHIMYQTGEVDYDESDKYMWLFQLNGKYTKAFMIYEIAMSFICKLVTIDHALSKYNFQQDIGRPISAKK